jgi:hypothetical protein
METERILEDQWPYVLELLPEDLEESARASGALVRKRRVKSAGDLLRLVLACSLCRLSLRGASAWSTDSNLAKLSNVAVLKRVRKCHSWLSTLVTKMLLKDDSPHMPSGALRLRVVDATCVSCPGSRSSDYRLHIGFDLKSMRIDDAWLTSSRIGETLTNFSFRPGDVVIGDRIYGSRRGVAHAYDAGAYVLVRINHKGLPLLGDDRVAFDILTHAACVHKGEIAEWPVSTAPCKGVPAIKGRLIVLHQSEEQARRHLKRVRRKNQKKCRKASPAVLFASAYVLIFTTLPLETATKEEVLEIFRFRWQIELAFKRLKSIVGFSELPSHKEEMSRTLLLGKILATLLVEEMAEMVEAFSPGER